MQTLALRELHRNSGGRFVELSGLEAVADYGDAPAEHRALRDTAGMLDLSFRSRICLTGGDRVRFLHGQVTNDIKRLKPGEGCYAALVTAKGRMESDLNVFALENELLLDFEPGLLEAVTGRLEKFIVADDVQVVDVAPHYGLLSVQGPCSARVLAEFGLFPELPPEAFNLGKVVHSGFGEVYLMNQARLGTAGFDVFIPSGALEGLAGKLVSATRACGGRPCGWAAFERARIEAGIPRFGADMDSSNLPQECGIEARAVCYTKGCYIGQEVLNRLHTMGHVNRSLCRLELPANLPVLPLKGDLLFHGAQEAGYITSVGGQRGAETIPGLGYVRREAIAPEAQFCCRGSAGEFGVRVRGRVGS